MKIFGRLLITVLTILIISAELPINMINTVGATSEVQLKLTPQPYIDVVLAKAKTETNLENFKTDLITALNGQNVDTTKVNITAIEAQQVNMQTSFEWHEDKSESIGNITITNSGQNVEMIGNGSKPGKNAIWIIPSNDLVQTFTFGYNIDFGDSFNAAGMLLRVKESSEYLTGYMLSFNNPAAWGETGNWGPGGSWCDVAGVNKAKGAIWKFKYYKNKNDFNIEKELVKPLNINTNGTLTVKASKKEIEVTGGGLTATTIPIQNDPQGTGFGFFSDHFKHSCNKIGQFSLTNINLQTENSKTLEEVLREPSWREDAIKVLVNVEDVVNEQLDKPTALGELLVRMMNDGIYYVGWGNSTNKAQTEDFIKSNSGKGTFIENTTYQNSITETAKYIKSLIPTSENSNYVLLTDNTILSSVDPSIMTNTKDSKFPNGKWRIIHDCEYFENNIGQFAESGNYLNNMITSFDKTGEYEIFYEDKNVDPQYIYVHRRPVAEFEVTRQNTDISYNDLSYDLDKASQSNGIQEKKWEHKEVGNGQWSTGQLASTSGGTNFLVQLTVKDFQNTWSEPVSKYITTNDDVPPIASFEIKNRNTSKYEKLEVVDGSYDPFGGEITKREWILYDHTDRQLTTSSTPILDYKSYGEGDYTLGLKVTNNRGKVSEEFKRTFKIIPDDEAPEFTATPTYCEWTKSIDVNLKFTDRLGSGFAGYQYEITDSQTSAENWSEEIPNQTDNITINTDGTKYLHIKARDNANNESKERVVGPYKIDKTPPNGSVTHDTSWVIDYTVLNWEFSDAQSGYDRTELPNKQSTQDASGTYKVTENGEYVFTIYDKLGNSKTVTREVNNIDKTPPEIDLSLDQMKLTNQPINIKWKATDSQSGFSRIILPNNTVSEEATGNFQISHRGMYTFICYDKVGNSRIYTFGVANVDTRCPKLTITQDDIEWTNGDVKLQYIVEDYDSGIKEFILPNSNRLEYPWSWSERILRLKSNYIVAKNGVYTFVAYDQCGNSTIEQYEVKNIDKIIPNLTLIQSEDKSKIQWSASDEQSGIDRIVLPTGQTIDAQESGEFAITKKGRYTFILYDKAGNYTIEQIAI